MDDEDTFIQELPSLEEQSPAPPVPEPTHESRKRHQLLRLLYPHQLPYCASGSR